MSLEEKQNVEAEETSFVDEVLGGADHSPADEAESDEGASEKPDDGDELIPDEDGGDEFPESDDSIGEDENSEGKGEGKSETSEKPTQEPDDSALKQEIESLQKRLHDTQAAFHKATGERAALKKELDELKSKKENEDDWFSSDDKERMEKLEADIKKSDEEIASAQAASEDIAKKEAVARWDAAAAAVIKEHPDFEKVMYDTLVPLLDPQKGNPQVRSAWESLQDKSPASQYAFAKNVLDILEFQRDPKAYKEKMRQEIIKQNNHSDGFDDDDTPPVGKEGLDMLPSADMPAASAPRGDVSFVDAVFG